MKNATNKENLFETCLTARQTFRRNVSTIRILNIICGNEGESDELNFTDANNEKYTIFYDRMLEAIDKEITGNKNSTNNKFFSIYRSNEMKYFHIPTENEVKNFTFSVLNKAVVYDSEGNQC